ncbi:hypothetical protein NQ317_019914 [Molorchus minor]|uniref:Uncharacterized protein n=1 Tax=Molorchus minor TaxID=1323400 RepID=A0ABQ9K4L0_9CUCU|nr:hypothetical protein NQ317_019914 [Molorchus minor]
MYADYIKLCLPMKAMKYKKKKIFDTSNDKSYTYANHNQGRERRHPHSGAKEGVPIGFPSDIQNWYGLHQVCINSPVPLEDCSPDIEATRCMLILKTASFLECRIRRCLFTIDWLEGSRRGVGTNRVLDLDNIRLAVINYLYSRDHFLNYKVGFSLVLMSSSYGKIPNETKDLFTLLEYEKRTDRNTVDSCLEY